MAPDDCPSASTELEIWTHGPAWATEQGKTFEPYEACLVAPADEAFAVTMHHVKLKGGASEVGKIQHNFSVFADSLALKRVFYGDPVSPGKERTFELPSLPAGTYLFRCDIHPQFMKGILVAS